MKKSAILLLSTGIVFLILGCSGNSPKAVTSSAPAVVQASSTPATASAVMPAALPAPSVEGANQQAWRSEDVKDEFGKAVAVKGTSLDGKFDLVILQRGSYSFVSVVRHAHWEAAHNRPGKGKLMYLRAKFEDGEEKRIEWDELGFATENLCSVLWSYPAKTDAPIGSVTENVSNDSVGGDQRLIQDMMDHKAMLLEIEPGVTTQFDVSGLALGIERARKPKPRTVLAASQSAE